MHHWQIIIWLQYVKIGDLTVANSGKSIDLKIKGQSYRLDEGGKERNARGRER